MDPIASYGIILYYEDESKVKHYLIAQRRDSIEYSDFIRSQSSLTDLYRWISLMTPDERNRIYNNINNFDVLWYDVMGKHVYNNRSLYNKSKMRFIKNKNYIMRTLCLFNYTSSIHNPIWVFPKGRKSNKMVETDIQCAFREFHEETSFSLNKINHKIMNEEPVSEYYIGTNSKKYCTHYFIVKIDEKLIFKYINIQSPFEYRRLSISDEILDLKWVIFSEASNYLNPSKVNILYNIETKY